ncbi:MAG: carbohydrate ABC transporter permease [Candidatus Goldiibacteriota bacterium]
MKLSEDIRKADLRKIAVPWLFVLPLLIFVAVLIAVPVIGAIFNSLLRDIPFLPQKFILFQNYADMYVSSSFRQSLGFTLLFIAVSVPLELALGILLAVLMNENIKGKSFLRAAVLVPWAVPIAVSAKVWELIYNYHYGLANFLLPGIEINWLGTSTSAFFAIVAADVWKTVPFVAIIVLAGLQAVPGEIYEQAKVDRANFLQRFFYITVPVLKPVITVALLFRTIDALRIFDIIYVLTGGGPGGSTNSLSMLAYSHYLTGDYGAGSAVSVVLFVIALVISVFYVKTLKFKGEIG